MPTFRPVSQEIVQQQDGRTSNTQSGPVDLCGLIEVKGGGDVTVAIEFPCRFFEKPCFTYGYELGENQVYASGKYPQAHAAIASWTLGRRGETGDPFYMGAKILIIIATSDAVGPEYVGTLHYRFAGRALLGRG